MKNFVFCLLLSLPVLALADRPAKFIVGKDFSIMAGEQVGSVVVIGSRGSIAGTVEDLVAIGSHVELQPTARVEKEIVSVGSEIIKHPGSLVATQEVGIGGPFDEEFFERFSDYDFPFIFWWPGKLIWVFLTFLASLAVGYLYLNLAPRFNEEVRWYLSNHSLGAFAFGVLGQFLVFPGALLLLLTLVGIPLIPIYLVVVFSLMILGYLSVAFCIGTSVLKGPSASSTKALASGLLILAIVKLLPFVGAAIAYLALVVGFGAVLRKAYSRIAERGSRTPSGN